MQQSASRGLASDCFSLVSVGVTYQKKNTLRVEYVFTYCDAATRIGILYSAY